MASHVSLFFPSLCVFVCLFLCVFMCVLLSVCAQRLSVSTCISRHSHHTHRRLRPGGRARQHHSHTRYKKHKHFIINVVKTSRDEYFDVHMETTHSSCVSPAGLAADHVLQMEVRARKCFLSGHAFSIGLWRVVVRRDVCRRCFAFLCLRDVFVGGDSGW